MNNEHISKKGYGTYKFMHVPVRSRITTRQSIGGHVGGQIAYTLVGSLIDSGFRLLGDYIKSRSDKYSIEAGCRVINEEHPASVSRRGYRCSIVFDKINDYLLRYYPPAIVF